MIAIPHHLPFVRVGENSLAPCKDDWIEQLMLDATHDTNVPQWLALDISEGIQQYLKENYQGTVIESDELFLKISQTLTGIGMAEIAEKIDRSPPPIRISLSDLARRAGESYELAFFQLLEDKCQEVLDSGVCFVECHGLVNCVRTLKGSRRWNMSAEALKKEIEVRIDEFRSIGELSNPVFNVTVAP